MTLREEQEQVQRAVSHSLAHLREDPWLAQRVLANAKGEKPVKKKLSGAVVFLMALTLAMLGTAYALFSSQVAEFFGQHWNRELGQRLQEGKIAQIGESVTIGDVVFTLDEVVYRSRGLYGVGTARALDERDVLLPEELANEGEGFPQSEAAQALAEQAKMNGGRLLVVTTLPGRIGVDGGTLLQPGTMGYYDLQNADGSLTFSFEAEDGFALTDGSSYQIELESWVDELDSAGEFLGQLARETWLVQCAPVSMAETAGAEAVEISSDEAIPQDDYELWLPEAYQAAGTLPVYRAIETDFRQNFDPAWLNQSGIEEQHGDSYFVFRDHAELAISRELISYMEYSGERYDYNQQEREAGGDPEPMYGPVPALSQRIASLGSEIYTKGFFMDRQEITLARTELDGLTLADAQAQAEALMDKLGLGGYALCWALDLDIERIRNLGAAYNAFWYEGEGLTNLPRPDFAQATSEDEGYYLHYTPLGVTDVTDTRHEINFFVNARGIVYAGIRANFTRGDILSTPERLISPQAAVSRCCEEAAREGTNIASIRRVALTSVAARAEDRAEGMWFTPAWQLRYTNGDGYNEWAEINAVDGTLLDAMFRAW